MTQKKNKKNKKKKAMIDRVDLIHNNPLTILMWFCWFNFFYFDLFNFLFCFVPFYFALLFFLSIQIFCLAFKLRCKKNLLQFQFLTNWLLDRQKIGTDQNYLIKWLTYATSKKLEWRRHRALSRVTTFETRTLMKG